MRDAAVLASVRGGIRLGTRRRVSGHWAALLALLWVVAFSMGGCGWPGDSAEDQEFRDLQSMDFDVARRATDLISQRGASVLPRLLRVLESGSVREAGLATWVLVRMDVTPVIGRLEEIARGGDFPRQFAATVLLWGKTLDEAAAIPVVAKALLDESADMRSDALSALLLRASAPIRASPALLAALSSMQEDSHLDQNPGESVEIERVLERLDEDGKRYLLEKLRQYRGGRWRVRATFSWGGGNEEVKRALVDISSDKAASGRDEALWVLKRLDASPGGDGGMR